MQGPLDERSARLRRDVPRGGETHPRRALTAVIAANRNRPRPADGAGARSASEKPCPPQPPRAAGGRVRVGEASTDRQVPVSRSPNHRRDPTSSTRSANEGQVEMDMRMAIIGLLDIVALGVPAAAFAQPNERAYCEALI